MRKKLVAGNWKMHGNFQFNAALLERIREGVQGLSCDVAVCVPFPYLMQAKEALLGSGVSWGAQNVSEHRAGAFTGEVSVSMLSEFGCRYVIVGHSERRGIFGESDDAVSAKLKTVLSEKLHPILCVGETLQQREAGLTQTVVAGQVAVALSGVSSDDAMNIVIAYEPVWAIGTGLTATPDQVQQVHGAIRTQVAELFGECAAPLRIVYGGSVKPQNAGEIFAQQDVDGGLIGGAALVADDFLAICQMAG